LVLVVLLVVVEMEVVVETAATVFLAQSLQLAVVLVLVLQILLAQAVLAVVLGLELQVRGQPYKVWLVVQILALVVQAAVAVLHKRVLMVVLPQRLLAVKAEMEYLPQ
jgi:hypothetical protein